MINFEISKQQIDEFFQKGWIVVENLFTPLEMQKAALSFDLLHQRAKELKTTQNFNNSYYVLDQKNNDTIIKRVVWAGGDQPYLLELGTTPKLLKIASQLLGHHEMDHLLNQAHFKLPGDGVMFDWHQDIQHRDKGNTWQDLNGKGSYVQTAILIDDMTPENGPLLFVPGSSQWGKKNFASSDYAEPQQHKNQESLTSEETLNIDKNEAHVVTGTSGSVLFFGPYTVHASFENLSHTPRRVLINGYAYPGANKRVYPGSNLGVRINLNSAQEINNSLTP